ncbi:hypothetical protein HGG74_16700 [Arthrobacter sp. E918]|uniref:Recombinase n=1 Tax=Arthrobacter mobilis TaxID=2724944 RepID=A0A7X6HFD4_9MICC|nr:hypothetical protein [Arthrobacter mobilis]
MLDKGKADHLMSTRLDRVFRAVSDFAGRRRAVDRETVAFIRQAKDNGDSLRKIADALTAADLPTPQGGKRWYASSVKPALDIYGAES